MIIGRLAGWLADGIDQFSLAILFVAYRYLTCSNYILFFETMPHSPDSHPFINRCHRKREGGRKTSSTDQEKVSKIIAFPKCVRSPTTTTTKMD